MKLNKVLAVAGIATLATGVLASCGGGNDKSNTLTVWGPETQTEVLEQLCKEFKEANPDITLDIKVDMVAEPDITTKMTTDIAGSADVFAYANDATARLQRLGALAEVSGDNLKHLQGIMDAAAIKSATAPNGKVYGYPMTGDNGYFLYYDKSVLSADDVKNFDTMLAKLESKKKALVMSLDDSWYDAGFFFGTGCKYGVEYDDQGNEKEIICDFNSENGLIAAKAMMNIATHKNKGFINGNNDVIASEFAAGKGAAAITGTWNATVIKEALGENYAATKLPEFTVEGKDYQMGSFAGYKVIGVNSQSKHLDAAHMLAKFLTDKHAQEYRYAETGVGPSCTEVQNSAAVKEDIALSALMLQNQFATPQESVPSNYWDAVGTFGKAIISDSEDKITSENVQAKLDQMVKLIMTTKKPEEK